MKKADAETSLVRTNSVGGYIIGDRSAIAGQQSNKSMLPLHDFYFCGAILPM